LGKPTALGGESGTKCAWIDSANMEVNEKAEKGLMTVSAMETRRNKGNQKK